MFIALVIAAIGSKQMKLRSAGGESPCPPRPFPDGFGAHTTADSIARANHDVEPLRSAPDRHRGAALGIADEVAEHLVEVVVAKAGLRPRQQPLGRLGLAGRQLPRIE